MKLSRNQNRRMESCSTDILPPIAKERVGAAERVICEGMSDGLRSRISGLSALEYRSRLC